MWDFGRSGLVHMMSAQEGAQKADAVMKLSKGGCVKMPTGGINLRIFVDVIYTWPIWEGREGGNRQPAH